VGSGSPKTLDIDAKQEVKYCIPEWLRDEQIALALKRPELGRIKHEEVRGESIAVVCYGPSLKNTWEEVKGFKYIITCSGAHKFLLERGIVPTWHVEVDPREHKVELLGKPHEDVVYLPASCCHPKYFDALMGHKVNIWHVYESSEEAQRKLPRGEWAITGGCNVGLRAMSIARFFGFREMHIFGMDGNEGPEEGKKHAGPHPLQDGSGHSLVEYPKGSGVMYKTTPSLLESAKQTFHELDMMPDVKAVFHGSGLVQAMHQDYVPKQKPSSGVAAMRPELISNEYLEQNKALHKGTLGYGVGGGKHAKTVLRLSEEMKTTSILDYGCGKGYLAKAIPFPIWEYDPAIEGKEEAPRPADIVVCLDVLEHIEPERLDLVLEDLRRVTRRVGYFVIHTGPSMKTLPDGRNAHLIQENKAWWTQRLSKHFMIGKIVQSGPLLHCVVGPPQKFSAETIITAAKQFKAA
jgi:2-polyprenyl-3-methyl-5-hydroxy-6-metoxy-1,4-benzoquinol methylase